MEVGGSDSLRIKVFIGAKSTSSSLGATASVAIAHRHLFPPWSPMWHRALSFSSTAGPKKRVFGLGQEWRSVAARESASLRASSAAGDIERKPSSESAFVSAARQVNIHRCHLQYRSQSQVPGAASKGCADYDNRGSLIGRRASLSAAAAAAAAAAADSNEVGAPPVRRRPARPSSQPLASLIARRPLEVKSGGGGLERSLPTPAGPAPPAPPPAPGRPAGGRRRPTWRRSGAGDSGPAHASLGPNS